MRLPLSCLLLAGLGASPLAAQRAPTIPPDTIALRYVETLKSERWDSASRLMDPAELAELGSVFQDLAKLPGAEEELRQLLRLSKDQHPMTLQPAEYMAKLLAASSRQEADAWNAVKSAKYRVIGTVTEGKDQAHVVIRAHVAVANQTVTTVEVRSLRLTDVGWRLQLPAELRGLVAGFRAAANQSQ